MGRKIVFIINPIAGRENKEKVVTKIKSAQYIADDSIEIYYTKCAGDAFEEAKRCVEKKIDIVVAVGGDGTVNEIARALIHSDTALCIIPIGSGNGLARDLHIPLKVNAAVDLLQHGEIRSIDVCYFNNQPYVCTAGVGFDAEVGKVFAESKNRGLLQYLFSSLKVYVKMKPVDYKIIIDGNEMRQKAFDITFANAGQFGNNAYISPVADLRDGLIDAVVMRPFPWYMSAALGLQLFTKRLHKSRYVKIYKCKSAVLERAEAGFAHFDGEPVVADKRIEVSITPLALKVVVKK